MKIQEVKLVGTTDGAGAATVQSPNTIVGRLLALIVDLSALAATADTTVSFAGTVADRTVLTLTDSQANAAYEVKLQNVDDAGAALTGEYDKPIVEGALKAVVAQGGATATFTVVALVEVST